MSKFDCWSKSVLQRYPKCFCCLVQVSYHGFNKKKVEGQTFLGLACTLLDLACTLLLEKLYLDAKPSCVYGRKISLRLVQLNLVSLGTKGNYKEGMEIVDRKRPNCGNVILSIDAHFIVVAITALYVTEIWVLSELSNDKMWVFSLKHLDCLGATVR